jgi:hypothetical protein
MRIEIMNKIFTFIIILSFATIIKAADSNTLKTIGIGTLYDSTTYISEHYSLMAFLRTNPLPIDVTYRYKLTPAKSNYHITGKIKRHQTVVYYYTNGKKTDTLTLNYNTKPLGKIFAFIRAKLQSIITNTATIENAQSVKRYFTDSVITQKPLMYDGKYIVNFLSTNYQNTVPPVTSIQTLANNCDFKLYSDKYSLVSYKKNISILPQFPKAYYEKKNESDIYFLNGGDVPDDYQDFAKTLIFPVYNRPGIALSYIACGDTLFEVDPLLSIMCYNSALTTINHLMCHDFQKFMLKAYIYDKLEFTYKSLSFTTAAKLSALSYKVIMEYLGQEEINNAYGVYNKAMSETDENLSKVETKARQIRSERRAAIAGAIVSAGAGAVSGFALKDIGMATAYFNTAGMIAQNSIDASSTKQMLLQNYVNDNQLTELDKLNNFDIEILLDNIFYIKDIMYLLAVPEFKSKCILLLFDFANENKDNKLVEMINGYSKKYTDKAHIDLQNYLIINYGKQANKEFR